MSATNEIVRANLYSKIKVDYMNMTNKFKQKRSKDTPVIVGADAHTNVSLCLAR